eukprot:Hpha_TRINITY_DN34624_c0_g1::TRINITY_DN34624_c0_g1_i1::g.21121::m.21121
MAGRACDVSQLASSDRHRMSRAGSAIDTPPAVEIPVTSLPERTVVSPSFGAAIAAVLRTPQLPTSANSDGYYTLPQQPVSFCFRFILGYRLLIVFILLCAALRPWRWTSGPSTRFTSVALDWEGATAARITRLDQFVRARWVLLRSASSGNFLAADGRIDATLPRGVASLKRAMWRVVVLAGPRGELAEAVIELRPSPQVYSSDREKRGLGHTNGRVTCCQSPVAWVVGFPRVLHGRAVLMQRNASTAKSSVIAVNTEPPAPRFLLRPGPEGSWRDSWLGTPSSVAALVVFRVDFPDE